MSAGGWAWGAFAALVVALLAVDLWSDRRARRTGAAMSLRSAVRWSAAWIGLALAFSLVVAALLGPAAWLHYVTAWALEKSLSVDNLFVFVIVFAELRIPPAQQREVLLWGIVGALVMRAVIIAAGVALIQRFDWVMYPFGIVIVLAAARLLWGAGKEEQLVRAACGVCDSWVARIVPITSRLHGDRFVARLDGRLVATPLLVALVVIETSDVLFAMDSVPAVLSITREPFIVYTSNVFAMLGLRALYFVVGAAIGRLRYLRPGLAVILLFVGARLLLGHVVELPVWSSLAVIAVTLTVAIGASLRRPLPAPASEGEAAIETCDGPAVGADA